MTRKRWTAALLGLLFISCSETDQFSPTPASLLSNEPVFLRFSNDALQAAETSAAFWAVKGEARTLVLRYGDTGQEYLRFDVGANTLVDQDSVRITVRADDGGDFVFHFAPAGLRFNPQAPAVLTLNHARTNPDVDRDGDVDLIDTVRSLVKGVWKRESIVTPWLRIPSINLGVSERTDIYDFTSFGMAVD
jgi:hypothetical protein